MKTIGIIGGFGPEATVQCILKLVETGRIANHGTQPQIILRNVSVPRNLEHDLLVNGNKINLFIPLLKNAAKELERAGADIIILPCNTLHVHERAIRSSITVPFISIVTSTVQFLQRRNLSLVGFLVQVICRNGQDTQLACL